MSVAAAGRHETRRVPPGGTLRRSGAPRPAPGWALGAALLTLALGLYTLGFLSLGRAPLEALRIAMGHVAPAAVAAALAWRLQLWVRARATPAARWTAHAALALLFGLLWAGGLSLIAWAFSPEVLPHLMDEVLFWTVATGVLVYAALAGASVALALKARVLEREAAAARAELAALRARVEPHFLGNALEAIAGLVRADPEGAEEAVARLGSAMRRLLEREGDDPDALVPLAEELALARDTLFIERLRMGERLRVIEQVEDAALDCLVPPLTLQPLVENAVGHGLAGWPKGGMLSIAARCEGGRLVLEVADDGAGAEEAAFADAPGLGLDHLRRRLRAHFGEAAQMDVAASPGRGVSVRLALPAVEG